MNLPQFSVKHPVAVAMCVCGVLLLGLVSLNRLGTDLLPDVHSPRIVVALESGSRSPREMEDTYAEAIEGRLGTVRHVQTVRSVSYVGRIVVTADFAWDTDMDFALLEVEKQVAGFGSDRDVDNVVVARFDPQQLPVLTVGVQGSDEHDLDDLRRIAEESIARRLESLDGVAAVRVSGGRERYVVIEPDPYLLKSYGLTFADIRRQVQAANVDASGGEIEDKERLYIVRAAGEFKGLGNIRDVTVGYRGADALGERSMDPGFGPEKMPVKLSEIADVRYDYKEVESLVRLNGEECVGLAIYKESDNNTVHVVEAAVEELERIERDVPGIHTVVADDQARFIRVALREVYQTAAYGILLAVLILCIFLRNMRTTWIVCLAFPISIIATFNLMYYSDLTLNIMTLGGLALGAGMLVDNAIVVVENIYRHRQLGKSMMDSAVDGSREVSGAIIASTITTVVVFLPIVYVHGIAGELFKEQAITVAFSLISSLVVALAVIPAAAGKLLKVKEKNLRRTVSHPIYARLLGFCLDYKLLVLLICAALVGAAIHLLPQVGTEFLPKSDQGQFMIEMRLPEGTPIETTERYVRNVENVIRTAAGSRIETVLSRVGRIDDENSLLEEDVTGPNTAKISVIIAKNSGTREHPLFKQLETWKMSAFLPPTANSVRCEDVVAAIDPELKKLPEAKISYLLHESTLQQTIGSESAPIHIEVRGPDLDKLRELTDDIAKRLSDLNEVYNVRTSFEGGHPEVRILLDRAVSARFGLDTENVAAIVREKVDGEIVGDFLAEDEDRDIEIKFPEPGLLDLGDIEIENRNGALITLSDLAVLEVGEGPRTIERRLQQRAGIVAASPAKGVKFSIAVAAVDAALSDISVPRQYRIDVAGEEQRRAESFDALRLAMILAVALVYMVLAGQFESLLHPFVILLTVPLAGIGVVFAFFLLGRPFSVMAYIGAIMLAGIAVNDSIVLVDFVNQLRRDGAERRDAIIQAGQTRLRPIIMTSLTTMLALLPLSFGLGESAELRSPMAIAVIAGLLFSTVLTLFAIPVVYVVFDSLKRTRKPS